jgi:hypothetical protein
MANVSLDYIYRLVNDAWDKINDYAGDLRDLSRTYDAYIADLRSDINSLKNKIGNIDDTIKDKIDDILGGLSLETIDNAFIHVYDYIFDKVADLREYTDERYFNLGSELADLKSDIRELTDLPGEVEKRLDLIQDKVYNFVESKFLDLIENWLDTEVK